MAENSEINICIAQIKVIPGQPRINTEKILKKIEEAKTAKVDLIVFSEMVVPGYVIADMWERNDFLEECKRCGEEIIYASKNIAVAFGNIDVDDEETNEDGRVRKYNSCFIARDGHLVSVVCKTLQPNYRLFDDNRHFYDKRKLIHDGFNFARDITDEDTIKSDIYYNYVEERYEPSIRINGVNIAFLLCEDCWDTDYSFHPIDILAPKCDMIVNISCSPFTMGKNDKRDRVFTHHAIKHKKPIIYVNNVGIQNNGKTLYTFDGNSGIYDCGGLFDSIAEPFDECCCNKIITPKYQKVAPCEAEYPSNIEMLYKCLRYGIKEFMDQIGVKKVVIGASGGIDSAVVAALFSSVMPNPKEDLYLVNMPSKFNSQHTKLLAEQLAKNIGCKYYVIPIEESVNSTRTQLQSLGFEISNFCFENIQARDRSARVLSAIASSVGGVFTCNANKSEMTVGYTTLYGDLGGFFAPLADVWKTDVYKLANYINEINGDYAIPSGSITVKPSAELSEKQDVTKGLGDPLIYEYHDLLFKSWVERWNRATPADILQWTLDRRLEENLGCEFDIVVKHFNGEIALFIEDLEKWWNLFDGFAFAKRIQAPPVLATSKRSYGFDLRESQTAPFYSKRYFDLKNELLLKTSKEERFKTILDRLPKEDIIALKDYWKVI